MKVIKEYSPNKTEKKWQKKWLETKVYSPELAKSKKPFYNLMMFPYPSAEGLHAGNMFAFTGSDVYGRFKRMQGYDVFEPIGLDGFGIHSENYALKVGRTPQENAEITQTNYYRQLKEIGAGFDWEHTLETYDPDYYKWTQWVFIQAFKAGLAYRKKAKVNFCPKDKTVLSDEQVMTPKQAEKEPLDAKGNKVPVTEGLMVCERCGTIVEKKEIEVWFFRITNYAEKLLQNLDKINWSERVVKAQREWIGKSEGRLIDFKIKGSDETLTVFTTRPDTLNSATFIVIADKELYEKHSKEKIGEFTGNYAINPLNDKLLPIWKASYVAPDYGTGAVMGVPAYDERDAEFAKKYDIEIINLKPKDNKVGTKHINYHLRDWGIGRQRYWGPPIPMIHCKRCAQKNEGYLKAADWDSRGWWPEENLPVKLPVISDYTPEGNGAGPLANHPEFYEVKCPHCGAEARRETDVSDTFLDSSWYFLRYPSTNFDKVPFDPEITKNWLPVSQYFGGAEHAVLHLMYCRFITMFLHDLKYLDFEEPAPNFFAHGLVIKDGAKMSKSRGNVVNPDEYIKKFGADILRIYLMFMGPMDSTMDFRDTGIEGMQRFIKRIWNLYQNPMASKNINEEKIFMNKTIQKVTKDILNFRYNTAISSIMEFVNFLKANGTSPESLKVLAGILAPFTPHLSEELWVEVLKEKYSVHTSSWPKVDSKYLESNQSIIIIQINGKTRSQIQVDHEISQKEVEVLAKADPKAKKQLKDSKIKKVIYIPGKIINFVI